MKTKSKQSAGILLYRFTDKIFEVLIVHPGGPFWAKKDLNAWSIPKGEFAEGEDPLQAARREFEEEIGQTISGDFISLSPIKQNSGKIVFPFALEKNIDVSSIRSNYFSMEWPPGSGIQKEFPEIDKAAWVDHKTSRDKLIKSQSAIVDELMDKLKLE